MSAVTHGIGLCEFLSLLFTDYAEATQIKTQINSDIDMST